MKRLLLSVFIFSVFSACTSISPTSKARLAIYTKFIQTNKLIKLDKIVAFSYRGWQSLDNQHLIINSSHNTSFLVTFHGICSDLKYANSIAFRQSLPNVLQSRIDYILVPESLRLKCFISSLHSLTKPQVDELQKLILKVPK